MNLIKSIHIKNLRSIQNQTLSETGSLNALIGRNSSGKSNILRALNLFFNGQLEQSKSLNFLLDHYEQEPRIRRKKCIEIAIDFELPEQFRLRKELSDIERLGKNFTIKRSWTIDQFRKPVEQLDVVVNGESVKDGIDIGHQFLSLITFRYIPHRTIPSVILKQESQSIANLIFRRMKSDGHGQALLKSLNEAAVRMLADAGKYMQRVGAPLNNPSVATPKNIAEMLTMSGFQAKGDHGQNVPDDNWGAGHQSFFLYQVLCSLDASYGQSFGWKQATIWGIEEPEAALHKDLETRLAEQFREWCFSRDLKLQIFITTHSPTFCMASDNGYWVELTQKESKFQRLPTHEIVRSAERQGVSGWVHPVLYYPWNPVVMVEGQIDEAVLTHAAGKAGLHNLRFVSLPSLDPSETRAGKDKVISFLKQCRGMIQNRLPEAPFLVLFDWDATEDDLNKAKKAYGSGAERFVLRMNERRCDPRLGKSFRGIERFYPYEIIMEAHEAGEIVIGVPRKSGHPCSIAAEELSKGKNIMHNKILRINSIDRIKGLVGVLADITSILNEGCEAQTSLPGFNHI